MEYAKKTYLYTIHLQALIHGLNRHYYSIAINYRKNELEQKMLLNLHKKKWTDGLLLEDFHNHEKSNEKTIQVMIVVGVNYNVVLLLDFFFVLLNFAFSFLQEMLELAKNYNKAIQEEEKLTKEKLAIANVGKLDPKRHLSQDIEKLMTSNIVQTLGAMLDTVTF
jgi:26S proteasome regulatory subunit N11